MRHFVSVGLLLLAIIGIEATKAADVGPNQEKKSQEKQDQAKTGQQKESQAKAASVWMTKKLDYSKEILAGITVADPERVKAAAGHIRTLNKVEAFVRSKNPAYREQLKAFQEANEEILRRAEADDLEGAATAFSQMTTSCIRCHKVLRDQPEK
jgi:PAB1-binding protein PBP1